MPPNSRYTLEICVDTPAAVTASAAVADRIELCSGLDLGGLTPDIAMMEHAASVGIETHVLIRPRTGDFAMTPEDIAISAVNIQAARQLGLAGVVIGAERNGALDQHALEALVKAADGIDITLHRVIDVVDDPIAAIDVAVELGAVRVLTSGGAQSAAEGVAGLARLHAAAAGRIEIMAGSAITSANLPNIVNACPITSFHASCSKVTAIDQRYSTFGFGGTKRAFDLSEAKKIAAFLQAQTIAFDEK